MPSVYTERVFGKGLFRLSGILILVILIQSCASTQYSLREPHKYMNTYNEVIEAVDNTFKSLRIEALEDERPGEDTYVIYFLPKSELIDERSRQQAATSVLTIRKIEERLVSVQIEEEDNNKALVRGDYERDKSVAKDVFNELRQRLSLKLKTQS